MYTLWLIHVDVWHKPTQYCKAIILQLKTNNFLKDLLPQTCFISCFRAATPLVVLVRPQTHLWSAKVLWILPCASPSSAQPRPSIPTAPAPLQALLPLNPTPRLPSELHPFLCTLPIPHHHVSLPPLSRMQVSSNFSLASEQWLPTTNRIKAKTFSLINPVSCHLASSLSPATSQAPSLRPLHARTTRNFRVCHFPDTVEASMPFFQKRPSSFQTNNH